MLRDPADKLEGDRILEESPTGPGFLLWRMVRDVTLWGTTPEAERASLFADGCLDDRLMLLSSVDQPNRVSELTCSLHALLVLPMGADAEMIALCCLEIAVWARDTGRPHTAVAFAQAGAVAAPTLGDVALFVGICARALGQSARAETWLRRAVAVARRERNWSAYVSALVELGVVYEGRGNALRAERFYRLAMLASRRHGKRPERMRAAYRLFRLLRASDKAGAAQFALQAERAAEADAAGVAGVLLDVARFWISNEQPKRARTALRRLNPVLRKMERAELLRVLALTALARSVAGKAPTAGVAWRAAWVLLRDHSLSDGVRYVSAVDLAQAARAGGDVRAARAALRIAVSLAPPGDLPALLGPGGRL